MTTDDDDLQIHINPIHSDSHTLVRAAFNYSHTFAHTDDTTSGQFGAQHVFCLRILPH